MSRTICACDQTTSVACSLDDVLRGRVCTCACHVDTAANAQRALDAGVIVYSPALGYPSILGGAATRAIVRTPDTCCGAWRFEHTRIPLWIIARAWAHGMSDTAVCENWPPLTVADLAGARKWIAAHPGEVENDASDPGADEEDSGCGGPREACMRPGCRECGIIVPRLEAELALLRSELDAERLRLADLETALRGLVEAWSTLCGCGDELRAEERPGLTCIRCAPIEHGSTEDDDSVRMLAVAFRSATALLAKGRACRRPESLDDLRRERDAAVALRDEHIAAYASQSETCLDTYNAIATVGGFPEWEYPGQLVRDVERLKRERDEAIQLRDWWAAECKRLQAKAVEP